jgi:3-oxoacyl-[acyl-carrier protein] reductase
MTEQAKIALVTGASRGIGRAIAIGMAKRGFDVAINDIERQKDALQEVAQEIEATGRRALIVYADVSSKADVEAMVKKTADAFGRIDAIVNNAGILIASRCQCEGNIPRRAGCFALHEAAEIRSYCQYRFHRR